MRSRIIRNSLRLLIPAMILMSALPLTANAISLVGVAVGDSITQGLWRSYSGSTAGVTTPQSGSKNYGAYLPDAVSQFNSANPDTLTLYNWGVAGDRSTEGVNRTQTALNATPNANLAFIMYGANDAYVFWGPSTTVTNLQIMAEKAIAANAVPILGTVTPNTNTEGPHWSSSDINNGYNTNIKSMAAGLDVPVPESIFDRPLKEPTTPAPVADHFSAMNPGWGGLNSGDGLHLNSSGNSVMASVWVDALENYLASLQSLIVITPQLLLLLLDN